MKKYFLLFTITIFCVTESFYSRIFKSAKTSITFSKQTFPLWKKNCAKLFITGARLFKVVGVYTITPGIFGSPLLWHDYIERQKAENALARFIAQEESISGL